jgi:hypothetical protein
VLVQSTGYPLTQVIQTPSGALIRSKDNDIHVYREDPLAGGRPPVGHKLKDSASGVYWLPHVAYRYFIAGRELYTTVTQQTFYFESKAVVQDPPRVMANWTISPPNPASYERVVQFDNEFRAAMANMPRPLTLGFHDNDVDLFVVIALASLCFLFMVGCIWRCKQRRDARKKEALRAEIVGQTKRIRETMEIPPELLQLIIENVRVAAAKLPEYITWDFRPFAQWLGRGMQLIRNELDQYGIPVPHLNLPAAFLSPPEGRALELTGTPTNRELTVAIPRTVLFDKKGENVLFDSRWSTENPYQPAPSAPKGPSFKAKSKTKNSKTENSGVVLHHKPSAWGFHYTNINLNSPTIPDHPQHSHGEGPSHMHLSDEECPLMCQKEVASITLWKLDDDLTRPEDGITQYYVDSHQHVHYIEDRRRNTDQAFNPRPDNKKIQKFYKQGLGFIVGQQVASVTALVDTGADVSLMSFQAAQRMRLVIKPIEGVICITQADQTQIRFVGYADGHMFLASTGYPHRWLIPAPIHAGLTKQDIIIGCDLQAQIGASIFDFTRQQIRLRDRVRKTDYLFAMSGRNKCVIKTEGPAWWALGYADPRYGWPDNQPGQGGPGDDDDQNGGGGPYPDYGPEPAHVEHEPAEPYPPPEDYTPQQGDVEDEPEDDYAMPQDQQQQLRRRRGPAGNGNAQQPANQDANQPDDQVGPDPVPVAQDQGHDGQPDDGLRRNPNRAVRSQHQGQQDFQAGPSRRQ